jgi:hypothetical protein
MNWTQPSHTPGKLCATNDPDYAEVRYVEHIPICKRHITREMKAIVAKLYGVSQKDWHKYEFDHLIPLGIGGANSIDNLWPQILTEAHEKDKVEEKAYLEMKSGKINQKQAVKMIWDWFKGDKK